MLLIFCPYLNAQVEMTDERERHIADHHPDLLPRHRERIILTLKEPDEIRRSRRSRDSRLFSRWFGDEGKGRYVVVVVMSEFSAAPRHWVMTAYFARRLLEGEIEWTRS